ncbi:helix-turn-helix domain-containing protein [Planktosalinus lacus]|uniref:Transcriptional regulator n=1 Tax=Planktosalinus lacus TaxID=1526573 RepID=A0A8J2V7I2_9FLAO|nr:helix-turn-helix transcriptional regulator [Planktosalinus lacus]GGD84902.1 transcriptional regulator [Planktosalinus lacus]
MPVGQKIKKHLKARGISIKQFAEDLDENRSLVSNYLNDKSKPSVKFLYKTIAYFPDLDLNYLFRDHSEVSETAPVYETPPEKLIREIEERLNELKLQLNNKDL